MLYTAASKQYGELRLLIADRVFDVLPEASRQAERYALDALDIKNTIVGRMNELTAEEFESILRTAFKEDEMTLVIAGAVLGAAAGEMQVILMRT